MTPSWCCVLPCNHHMVRSVETCSSGRSACHLWLADGDLTSGSSGSVVRIIGRGLIASALAPYKKDAGGTVVFAQGVSDSTCSDDSEFRREIDALYPLIRECAASGEMLVYLSGGGAVYGPTDGLRCEESALFPVTAYGRHQLVCESVIVSSRIRSLVIRLPNIVGSRQNPRQLVPSLVQQAIVGFARIQTEATRDILRADDAARLIARLAALPSPPPILNVASGRSTRVASIFEEIQRILGTNAHIEPIPGGERQVFSIDLLSAALSGVEPVDPEYVRDSLTQYVPLLARASR